MQSNDGRNTIEFTRLSSVAKAHINDASIRTILSRKYKIDTREIRLIDSSPFKYALLNEVNALSSLNLPDNAGLILIPNNKYAAHLEKICISNPNTNLHRTDNQFFAFCVAKAVKMEKEFRVLKKEFASHSMMREWRKKITKAEKPLKQLYKSIVYEYNQNGNIDTKLHTQETKKVGNKTSIIDMQYQAEVDKIRNEFYGKLREKLAEINGQSVHAEQTKLITLN